MKTELFDELVASVREGGAILRGEIARRHADRLGRVRMLGRCRFT